MLSFPGYRNSIFFTTKMQKIVALFSPGWPPEKFPNGVVTYVRSLSDAFADQGYQVCVFSPEQKGDATRHGLVTVGGWPPSSTHRWFDSLLAKIPFLDRYRLSLSFLGMAVSLEKLMEQHHCVLLEIEESFGAAWFVRLLTNIPVVVRLHGPWFLNGAALGVPIDARYVRRGRAEKKAISSADGVTSPSRDVLDSVRSTYDIPLSNAVVIPNPSPAVPVERRWTLSGSDRNSVLFVGRFDRHKGGDLVIDAFNLIAEACPESRLIFVGPDRGFKSDSGVVFKLSEYLQDHVPIGIRHRIDVKGSLPAHKIESLRRASHVTVMASRYENCSYALLEALSYGCPTVASAAGGNPEILQDGVTGLLFASGNSASLAEKVIDLLKNPDKATALGQAAAQDMRERFSPQRLAGETWAYYERILVQARNKRRSPLLSHLIFLLRLFFGLR
jgi:glycosyltransferase involved in cell wall biosynthesis